VGAVNFESIIAVQHNSFSWKLMVYIEKALQTCDISLDFVLYSL